MGNIIFIIISILITYKLYSEKGSLKYLWYLAGLLFIPETFIMFSVPVGTTFARFITQMFVLIILIKSKRLKLELNKFPFKKILVLILLGLIIIEFADTRVDLYKGIVRALGYFIDNFITLFIGYFFVKSYDDILKLYKFIFVSAILFCIYGWYNFASRSNDYLQLVSSIFNIRDYSVEYLSGSDNRFRISSFAWHPIYYGQLLVFFFLSLFSFGIILKKINIKLSLFILVCVLSNLFMVSSRTPLFSLISGLAIYFILGLNIYSKAKYLISSILLFISIITFIPQANNFFLESLDTFAEKGSSLEGSSLEMRNYQLASSIFVFNQNPIYGNGIGYINENLGFSTDVENRQSDSSFAGFESYLYELLIEQGCIGIFINLIFFIGIITYFYKCLNNRLPESVQLSVLSLAMFISFILFIFGTGDLGIFRITLLIMGFNIKGIELLKKNNTNE